MKIALVNLCKIEDFSLSKYWQDSHDFLIENDIDFVDYISGRSSIGELLSGFYEALKNTGVDLIWFVQGGNRMLELYSEINWDLVKASKKEFLGFSDFTNFSLVANSLGITCYYGPGLKNIKTFYPNVEDREFLVNFLKNKLLPEKIILPICCDPVSFGSGEECIIGGYSIATAFLALYLNIDFSDKILFIEHHYLKGEKIEDANYFIEAIKLQLKKNKPKAIMLGHSMLIDNFDKEIDTMLLASRFADSLKDLNVPIVYVDHFHTIIKLG